MSIDSYSFFALAAATEENGGFFPCKLSEWSASFGAGLFLIGGDGALPGFLHPYACCGQRGYSIHNVDAFGFRNGHDGGFFDWKLVASDQDTRRRSFYLSHHAYQFSCSDAGRL